MPVANRPIAAGLAVVLGLVLLRPTEPVRADSTYTLGSGQVTAGSGLSMAGGAFTAHGAISPIGPEVPAGGGYALVGRVVAGASTAVTHVFTYLPFAARHK